MNYLSVSEIAKKWRLSERTVRNYAKNQRIIGARFNGRNWEIPEEASKPKRLNKKQEKPRSLLDILKEEKKTSQKGSIYHKVQIELTYNSNHIEGSKLTHDQTRYIYETNTIGIGKKNVNVDDIVETANHFRAIDLIIEQANNQISESFVKDLHEVLKNGTSDSRKEWFAVGKYKKLPNEVAGKETTLPENVGTEMKKLLTEYNTIKEKSMEEIINFHHTFESIHPFQDGNGRVGRLIMFKECLRNNVTPFIIDEELKLFYYRGLIEWETEKGYLVDTCLAAQDTFKKYLDYFRILYTD
ncbi:Fic family protein [Enterococcus sp. LJL99]